MPSIRARVEPALRLDAERGLWRAVVDPNTSAPLDLRAGGYTSAVACRNRSSHGIGVTGYLTVRIPHAHGANVPVGNTPTLRVLRNLAEATR
jgi:hypothetical protein